MLTRQFNQPISQISMQLNSVVMALAGGARIFALLDEKPEVNEGDITLVHAKYAADDTVTETNESTGMWAWKRMDADGKPRYTKLEGDIVFKDVDFGYDERQVLKDVSFTIPEGSSTAIVDPSGSGKTTLCSLLARFYDPQGGSITLGGHDLREFTCDSLLRNLSMVFQNVDFFHYTVRANLLFGKPDATEEEMIAAAKKARCHDFILALPNGYDTVLGEGGGTLSGGERQRISIARAILKDAPIILLDEATASIDPENEHLIQDALTELTRGKTVITIAHRLATVRNADQILVISDGRVAERGTHEELLAKDGIYRRFTEIREKAEGWRIDAE